MKRRLTTLLFCLYVSTACLPGCGSSKEATSPSSEVIETTENLETSEIEETETQHKETSSMTEAEPSFYDRAEVRDVLNGTRTEKLGKYSVIFADSSECTDEILVNWYLNYVCQNDFNYAIIVYTDQEGYGIFESNGIIEIGDEITLDEYGDYSAGNNSDARIITIYEDGSVNEF